MAGYRPWHQAWMVVACWIAAATASGEMRTFTDAQGRAITAELVETTPKTVRIRREDGRTFEIEKSVLSAADRDFVAAWEYQRAFVFGGVEIKARRVRLDAERRLTKSSVKKIESWCYKFTVTNDSRARLDGLIVEWRVFFVDDTATAETDKLPLQRSQGRSAIGVLDPRATVELQSAPLELQITALRSGKHYSGTGKSRIKDSLEGVWVRVMRGREVLAEYANPTSLLKSQAW